LSTVFLEQLHEPKSTPSIIKEKKSREIPLAEHAACAAEKKYIPGFGEGYWKRRQLGRPVRRWEDVINMDLK
jgi:hypothetical protein